MFLKQGGEIYFKTDDAALFKDSISYLLEEGFTISWKTENLHQEQVPENIVTEHEKMFSEAGIPIKALIAIKK